MPRFLKSERLLKHSEFEGVYKKGKRISSKSFFINWIEKDNRRIGITVSGRVGKANIRNKIKRVIRDFFRLNKTLFPVADIVVTAKGSAAAIKPEEIRKELQGLIKKNHA